MICMVLLNSLIPSEEELLDYEEKLNFKAEEGKIKLD